MALVWKMRCPVHGDMLRSEKMIPMNKDGVISNEPVFFCNKCGNYYIHTEAVPFGGSFDYRFKKVINTEQKPVSEKSDVREVVCTRFSELRPYTEPFIPNICYKDQGELEYIRYGFFRVPGYEKEISGYYCRECRDFYIEEDIYDEIKAAVPESDVKGNADKAESDRRRRFTKYTFHAIKSDFTGIKTEEVLDRLASYEKCEENYHASYPFSLLHYAFAFRRFDIVNQIFSDLQEEELAKALHFPGRSEYSWITPVVCAKWNLNYVMSYDEKFGTSIYKRLEPYLGEAEHIDVVMEYTDKIDTKGHDVFDVFWKGSQPILDVIFFQNQTLAARQVEKRGFSIVMDEVGTGKTVSALYSVRDVLKESIRRCEKARVLVICPYHKREDWQSDIRRQLGRYAHIVEQSDHGEMYDGELKKVFFKSTEHPIFIAGQRRGNDQNGSYSALKGTMERFSESQKWNLVIIDEAHLSFDNYRGIRAERVMFLTATPIMVNAKGKRVFDDYIRLAENILEKRIHLAIDPIKKAEPTDMDVYVNWFREDMGLVSSKRKIRFVACKRWGRREEFFSQIKEDKGVLAALQYDQDDDYLYWAAVKYGYRDVYEVKKNGKMERLISVLHESQGSYIIFCEHKFVVDHIFSKLKDIFIDCIVAEKYGKYENQYGLENIQDSQLVNTLMQSLRTGKRVIFITTGRTGGTGLNLGEFDGIIHYELPFTSIELEQRFGRIDRIDTGKGGKTRDMIFLLNECREDEKDLEINRMLYYCTTKIDITCQFMPIRNTVLYYPEFIKRNGKAIHDSMECYRKEYVLSEENENRMREIRRKVRQYEKQITDHPSWKEIESYGRNLRLSAVEALTREKKDSIPDEYYGLLNSYLEYWKNTKPERNAYQKMYRMFLGSRKNAYHWLAIIGVVMVDSDSDIFVGAESAGDGDELKMIVAGSEPSLGISKKQTSIQKQIDEIMKLIEGCVFDNDGLKSFSSEGIFCYKDGRVQRSDVKQYRQGNAWK